MQKIESYSPMYVSEDEVEHIIQCMAEDIIYMHGMTKFFPTGHCESCEIIHSVSIFLIISTIIII